MSEEGRFRWWCAACDRTSEETFPSKREAHEAGVEHIGEADHASRRSGRPKPTT